MTIQRYAANRITGTSGDTKPTNVPDGAIFYETDTLRAYVKVSGSWSLITGYSGYSGYKGATGFTGATGSSGTSGYSWTSGQLAFPASQNASADVNTLDDYEEGTWTPTIIFDTTQLSSYITQSGFYVKVGKMVTLTGYAEAVIGSAASYINFMSGFPFAVGTGPTCPAAEFYLFNSNTAEVAGYATGSMAYMYNNCNFSRVLYNSFYTGGVKLGFMCTYFV